MDTRVIFGWIVALVAAELLILVAISKRHVRTLLLEGGRIVDQSGIGLLNILLRLGWALGMLAEVWLLKRPFFLWLFLLSAAVSIVALWLRIAAMQALKERWTLPTVVLPGSPRIKSGVYRWMDHPNWLGVCLEIVFVPLLHTAFVTAIVFLVLEGLLLRMRVRVEREALASAEQWRADAMPTVDQASPHAIGVIGAGAAGLAVARALQKQGLTFEVLDKHSQVGGLWANETGSPLYKNTHLISPKGIQAFSDMAMPASYCDFPHHTSVHAYLASYARQNELHTHIQLNAEVVKIDKAPSAQGWTVHLANGETHRYTHLILASGYHNKVNMPVHAGSFSGQLMHSKDYKDPSQLAGKRVLVVGAGQSAMDILAEAAVVAKSVHHSTRHNFICAPRYLLGKAFEEMQDHPPPILGSVLARLPLPKLFRFVAFISGTVMRINGLSNRKLGLPTVGLSDPAVLPTLDQKVYGYYAQGDITHRPGIRALNADGVDFVDGTQAPYDTIIFATGYEIDFPFLSRQALNWPADSGIPLLHQHVFHPTDPTLFVVGMVHPIGAHWRVFENQASLVAGYLLAQFAGVSAAYDRKRQSTDEPALNRHLGSGLMVNKQRYISSLQDDIASIGKSLPLPRFNGATLPPIPASPTARPIGSTDFETAVSDFSCEARP